MTASPEATFDTLTIIQRLRSSAGGGTANEAYLLSYLSCLLFVFKGNPSSTWGYEFTATRTVAPYAYAVSETLADLERVGLIRDTASGFVLTEDGERDLKVLVQLGRFKLRTPFLDAACGSTLAIPLPSVGESIVAEPELRRAISLSSTRPLLDDAGVEALQNHFHALSSVVPESADLLTPAMVWLTYLSDTIEGEHGAD